MEEIWKDVEGYEGYYQVSNLGRLRSLDRIIRQKFPSGKMVDRKYPGKIFTCNPNQPGGYVSTELQKDGHSKNVLVHRLVAQAFIPNPDNLPQVNHKDENKQNNCVENLEWCSNSYNVNYGSRNQKVSNALKGRKRSPEQAEQMRKRLLGQTPWNKGLTWPVICLDQNITFASSQEAAEWLGTVDAPAVQFACKHIACCGGHVFVYAKDVPENIPQYVYECYKHSKKYPALEEEWRLRCEN